MHIYIETGPKHTHTAAHWIKNLKNLPKHILVLFIFLNLVLDIFVRYGCTLSITFLGLVYFSSN